MRIRAIFNYNKWYYEMTESNVSDVETLAASR
jgi:hypothetical protein